MMISFRKRIHDSLGLIIMLILLVSFLVTPLLMLGGSVDAALTGSFRLKWTKWNLPGGGDGIVIGDVNNDGIQEIVKASSGRAVAIRGTDGGTVWSVSVPGAGDTTHPQMADLDKDGYFEIVVPIEEPPAGFYVLDGRNGTIEQTINQPGRTDSSPVIADIDGDGYPTIFFPTMSFVDINDDSNSTGWLRSYKYNMGNSPRYRQVASTRIWHPCSGGLSVADTDNDGEFELYMGDRDMYYCYPFTTGDRGYGNGVVSFWAKNLTERWRHPDILSSSHIPILADVNKDGILDVIDTPQRGGITVLNSSDGSAIRKQLTIYNSKGQPISGHYQSSVYDIDRDGNLEILMADGEHEITHDAVVWDLVQWKEDARIPASLIGRAYFGPQVGEVTGDGTMDIVLTNYTRLFIFDGAHNPAIDHTYPLVWMSGNLSGRLLYPVMQDIDNDGLVEIVVPSQGGVVYAFDTSAPAPFPRPRTEVPFYSERRMGVAEYVPPPQVISKSSSGASSSPPTSQTLAVSSTTSLLMPFNKSSSTTAIDYSVYGNNGKIKGSVTWTGNGMIGGAYAFNGGFITIPDSNSLDGNYQWSQMSAELWVYLSANQNGTRVIFKQPSYEIGFKTSRTTNNQLFAGIWTPYYDSVNKRELADYSDVVYTAKSLSVNKWYHVAFTYKSGDGLRLYLNGVQVAYETESGYIQRGLQPLYLGWFDYFKGMIDEVKIYSRQLTATEINNDYTYRGQPPNIDSYTPTSANPSVNEGGSLAFTQTSSDPDGGTLSYSWTLDSLQIATTQNWTYFPGYHDAGAHIVVLKVTDNNGYYDTQQWTVTVKQANGPPTINSFSPPNDPTIYEGGQQQFSITYSDPDGDPTTVHWYLNGTPTSTTNSYTFTATPGSKGTYNVTVVVSDGTAQTSHEWTLTVLHSNSPPIIDSYSPLTNPVINEGQSQTFNITCHDPDGDLVTVNWFLNGQPTVSGDSYTYLSNYASEGTYNVTVAVSDEHLAVTVHQWNLTVHNINRAPTINSYTPTNMNPQVNEGDALIFTQTSSDPDGDPLTTTWFLDNIVQANTQNWTYSPNFEAAGFHNVTLVVSDGGLHDSKQWNVQVININRAPTIDSYYPSTNPTIREEESQEFNITKHDSDNDPLSVSWFLNGTLQPDTSDSYIFTANLNSAGFYNVTLVVSDQSAEAKQQWILNVRTNAAPSIDAFYPSTDPTIKEGETQQFNITYHDSDGDPLTVHWYLNRTLAGTTATYSFAADYFSAGTYNVTVVVSDGLARASHEWKLTIINVNRPPVIDSYTPTDSQPKVGEGVAVHFAQTSSDPDGDLLSYSWLLNNVQQATTQNWTYSPNTGNLGNYNVTVVVTDTGGLFVTHYWNLSVVPAYQLTIEIRGNGETAPTQGTHQYLEGTLVSVEALPAYGWELDHWLLDNVNVGSNNPYDIVMNRGYNLTAVFIQFLHTVTLESVQDTTASWNLGSIKFNSVLYDPLPQNASKALASYSVEYFVATGYIFDHWETSGGISVSSATSNPTTVTVSGEGTLRAVYKSIIFTDGFESGNFGMWNGVSASSGETATVVGTLAHDGSYSGMFTSNGGGGSEWTYSYLVINENEVYLRGYFYIASGLPLIDSGDNFYFLRLRTSGQTLTGAGIRHSSTGVDRWVLTARHGSGWAMTAYASSPAIQMGRWYCIELHWKMDSVNGWVEMYVDGVKILKTSGINTAYYGNATSVNFGISEIQNVQNSLTVYGDSFVVSRAYIGPEAVNVQAAETLGAEGEVIRNSALFSHLTVAYSWIAGSSLLSAALGINLRRNKRRELHPPHHLMHGNTS